jgi:hypothetical protein
MPAVAWTPRSSKCAGIVPAAFFVVLLAARTLSAQTAAPAVAASAAAQPAQSPSAEPTPPVEVTVHGTRRSSHDVGADEVRAQDARSIPGTFGDPFQSIAALPGIAAMASGLPYFYVRGAPPADTGYFLDGIPVPALFHIGPGPSVGPPALVDRIELFPSVAPARFGRFAGGIIAAETTAPSPVARGEGSVRLFDASAFVESPIGDSSTAAVGGRYGYPDLLLSVFAPNLSLGYGDYTLRLTRTLTPKDALSLFAIGAYDHEEDSSQNLVPVDSQFHRVDLRYDHRWTDGTLRVASTFGYDRTGGITPNTANEIVQATSGRLRLELEQRIGATAHLSAGADANTTHYSFAYSALDTQTSPVGDEVVVGAYADLSLRLAEGVEIVPGLRVDGYYPSSGLPGHSTAAVDPKLAARVALSPDVTWVSAVGIAHQEPSYVVPIPGIRVNSPSGLQKVYQLSEGAEARLPWRLKARLTAFLNVGQDVTDYVSDCGSLLGCSSVSGVNGRTYGLELLVQRPLTQRLGGWLSYTLSRGERTIGNVPYLSPFDRTHVLSAVLHYDFGKGIGAGIRGTYYTGRPVIPSFAFLGQQSASVAFGPGQMPQHRLPEFYRIDLRVEKRWSLGPREWLALVAELFDATLTKEAVDYRCNLLSGICTASEIGPVALPSIGVEGGF